MAKHTAVLAYAQIAAILGMTKSGVRQAERRALRKLRRDPVLRRIAALANGD